MDFIGGALGIGFTFAFAAGLRDWCSTDPLKKDVLGVMNSQSKAAVKTREAEAEGGDVVAAINEELTETKRLIEIIQANRPNQRSILYKLKLHFKQLVAKKARLIGQQTKLHGRPIVQAYTEEIQATNNLINYIEANPAQVDATQLYVLRFNLRQLALQKAKLVREQAQANGEDVVEALSEEIEASGELVRFMEENPDGDESRQLYVLRLNLRCLVFQKAKLVREQAETCGGDLVKALSDEIEASSELVRFMEENPDGDESRQLYVLRLNLRHLVFQKAKLVREQAETGGGNVVEALSDEIEASSELVRFMEENPDGDESRQLYVLRFNLRQLALKKAKLVREQAEAGGGELVEALSDEIRASGELMRFMEENPDGDESRQLYVLRFHLRQLALKKAQLIRQQVEVDGCEIVEALKEQIRATGNLLQFMKENPDPSDNREKLNLRILAFNKAQLVRKRAEAEGRDILVCLTEQLRQTGKLIKFIEGDLNQRAYITDSILCRLKLMLKLLELEKAELRRKKAEIIVSETEVTSKMIPLMDQSDTELLFASLMLGNNEVMLEKSTVDRPGMGARQQLTTLGSNFATLGKSAVDRFVSSNEVYNNESHVKILLVLREKSSGYNRRLTTVGCSGFEFSITEKNYGASRLLQGIIGAIVISPYIRWAVASVPGVAINYEPPRMVLAKVARRRVVVEFEGPLVQVIPLWNVGILHRLILPVCPQPRLSLNSQFLIDEEGKSSVGVVLHKAKTAVVDFENKERTPGFTGPTMTPRTTMLVIRALTEEKQEEDPLGSNETTISTSAEVVPDDEVKYGDDQLTCRRYDHANSCCSLEGDDLLESGGEEEHVMGRRFLTSHSAPQSCNIVGCRCGYGRSLELKFPKLRPATSPGARRTPEEQQITPRTQLRLWKSQQRCSTPSTSTSRASPSSNAHLIESLLHLRGESLLLRKASDDMAAYAATDDELKMCHESLLEEQEKFLNEIDRRLGQHIPNFLENAITVCDDSRQISTPLRGKNAERFYAKRRFDVLHEQWVEQRRRASKIFRILDSFEL